MRIGFDAKRFYHNQTGLGNYSRTLVDGLQRYASGHQLFLYNPKPSNIIATPAGVQQVLPQAGTPAAWWRSFGQIKDWHSRGLHIYHGLSNELPLAYFPAGVKTVVTVHDIIYERYPHQYGWYETAMHRAKIKNACRRADVVIAISQQTKKDLQAFYKVPEEKIRVCYQSCNEAFYAALHEELIQQLKTVLQLPEHFFLYVGSVTERKNLLRIVQAMHHVGSSLKWPLIVVGRGKAYLQKVQAYLNRHDLAHCVRFLSYEATEKNISLNNPQALAALYHSASALVYPSVFEGWGIPVLEAHAAGLPVITSNISSMPEISGAAALYVDPFSVDSLAWAMLEMQNNTSLRPQLIQQGRERAQLFTLQACTCPVLKVYESLMQ